MDDLISREYMKSLGATCIASRSKDGNMFPIVSIDELPSVQPDVPDTNVGELISRQDVKDWLARWEGYLDEDMIARMQMKVADMPSVQPEIIRCKDCKHYMQTDTIHHRGWCWWWNHFTAIERYCSERALRGDSDE